LTTRLHGRPPLGRTTAIGSSIGLTPLVALALASCFGNPQTLGLPCTEHSACFDGLMCDPSGVCAEPSTMASMGDGDGDTGDTGDGDTGDGDGDGDGGDGDPGDGDGDDGDGDPGDGDGDGDTGEPVCGNGIREGSENCDGTDLDGMTCADHDYGGGTLACNSSCDLVFTGCCHGEGQGCMLLQNSCCDDMQCLPLSMMCG
jgi:hypothetical protein